MMASLVLIWIMVLLHQRGVFGADKDVVKTVPVMEGDSVTLNPDLTEEQKRTLEWSFAGAVIATVNITSQQISYNDSAERFRDRLQLDHQTGSLTIKNMRTADTGFYHLEITGAKLRRKSFSVTVYAPLPIPVITGYCPSSSSSSSRSLVCSVMNVSRANLSWYAGISVLSSISVSDLSISLSLHLEVQDQDKNTYSCVINNPVSNQTTHLDNITQLCCHTCAALENCIEYKTLGIAAVATVTFLVMGVVMTCIWKIKKPGQQETVQHGEEITYADPTFYKQKMRKVRVQKEDDVVYAGVAMSR